MDVLGIDVGGSGIKGAVVDTDTGTLRTDRYRLKTPTPSTPKAMGKVVKRIVHHFGWEGPIGCGMPGPLKGGRLMTANNIDKAWLGEDPSAVYSESVGRKVTVINDADAAGLAEIHFGAGKGVRGVVLLLTLGTGIGSALFINGVLVPNTEFGQIEVRGKKGERRAAAQIRTKKNLSWKQYAVVLTEYLEAVEQLLWPDLIILGGGVSKTADKFIPRLKNISAVVPAEMRNQAGIVGAALGHVHNPLAY
jgi:polyphosphate glucokinase